MAYLCRKVFIPSGLNIISEEEWRATVELETAPPSVSGWTIVKESR